MKIIFTGTGTPIIDPKYLRACASEVILIGNDALLFDCGRWVSMRLFESDIGIDPINYLFLTHHHDHTADLPQLTCRRSLEHLLRIYGPKGTKEALAKIKDIFDAYCGIYCGSCIIRLAYVQNRPECIPERLNPMTKALLKPYERIRRFGRL